MRFLPRPIPRKSYTIDLQDFGNQNNSEQIFVLPLNYMVKPIVYTEVFNCLTS